MMQPLRGSLARTVSGAILAASLLNGCGGAGKPADHVAVTIDSRDAVFFDDLLGLGGVQPATAREITGTLGLPAGADERKPVPAAVILHTSSGVTDLEWSMANQLNELGIASLVVDSFTARGIRRSGRDQTQVSESAMMADAYGALALLAADRRIRTDRIALIGFSKGAAVAFYGSYAKFAAPLGATAGARFAAHLAFYPWCGLTLLDPRTTGAPIMVHMGDRDAMTSPKLCGDVVASIQRADPQARVELLLYPGAAHAFNHPRLASLPPITLQAQNPGTCGVAEVSPDHFRETSSDRSIDHRNYRAVVSDCLGFGALVNYDSAATALAASRSRDFLKATLLAP